MSREPTVDTARAVEQTVRIAAPDDVVWQALTDAAELVRWFPLDARVSPGVGGKIWVRWGDGSGTEERIEIWQPGRHLRTGGHPIGAIEIATDYYLEGRAGETILRVVSSGFGPGADWDDMVESWALGWEFELQGLQHYLEHHRGVPRQVAFATARKAGSYRAVWQGLIGPRAVFANSAFQAVGPGDRYQLQLQSGQTLSGKVLSSKPPRQFAGTVREFNNALFRVHLYRGATGVEVWLWLATYGVPATEVDQMRQTLGRLVEQMTSAGNDE